MERDISANALPRRELRPELTAEEELKRQLDIAVRYETLSPEEAEWVLFCYYHDDEVGDGRPSP